MVVFESLRETGVSICEWDRFVTKKWHSLYSKIAFRKLDHSGEDGFNDCFEDFVRQTLGKPFKINAAKLFRSKNEGDNAL